MSHTMLVYLINISICVGVKVWPSSLAQLYSGPQIPIYTEHKTPVERLLQIKI